MNAPPKPAQAVPGWSVHRSRSPEDGWLLFDGVAVARVGIYGAGPAAVVRLGLLFDAPALEPAILAQGVGFAAMAAIHYGKTSQLFPAEPILLGAEPWLTGEPIHRTEGSSDAA